MRTFLCSAAFLGMFAAGLFSTLPVHAAGNVLLPQSGNDRPNPLPNLGLAPREEAPAKPADAGKPSGSAALPQSPLPPVAAPPAIPLVAPTPAPSSASLADYMAAAKQAASKIQAGIPTRVIQLPPPTSDPASSSLPNGISLEIADKYAWGSGDAAAVNRRLGIAPDQVSAKCRLSIDGTAASDRGTFPFDTGFSPHAVIRYDGALTGVTLRLQALCDTVPLPANAGYVTQVGDKYAVMLRQTACPAPPAGAQRIVFIYAGNGNGRCEYH